MTYVSLGLAGLGSSPPIALPDLASVPPDRGAHRGQQLPGAAPPSSPDPPDDTHERMLAAAAGRRGAGVGHRATGVLPARRAPLAVVPGPPAAPGPAGPTRPGPCSSARCRTPARTGCRRAVRASTTCGPSSHSSRASSPTANRYAGQVLVSVLEQVGELRWAAEYGATSTASHGGGGIAHQVARASAPRLRRRCGRLGPGRAGRRREPVRALRADPDLAGVLDRPDVIAALGAGRAAS